MQRNPNDLYDMSVESSCFIDFSILCSCWLWLAFLSLCLGLSRSSRQRSDVSVHMRRDPVRWRPDITTLLEIQCWVFNTCCCCLGWKSLIFSSSKILPMAAGALPATLGSRTREMARVMLTVTFLHYFSLYRHFFALVLPWEVSCFRNALYGDRHYCHLNPFAAGN